MMADVATIACKLGAITSYVVNLCDTVLDVSTSAASMLHVHACHAGSQRIACCLVMAAAFSRYAA
jgi:hypothetical protein